MFWLVDILHLIVYSYITLTIVFLFVFALASKIGYDPAPPRDNKKRSFVIMIPAYKEDDVIIEVVIDALGQNYPSELYDVVVIADGFEKRTLEKLTKTKALVLAKDFDISTKTRAINYAFANLKKSYDQVCILDADNIMNHDFLNHLNVAFSNGYLAVQGHRIAKNLNTNFAVLDALSEEINNNIFRHGQRTLGLSSTLIGSAMAFDFEFFKQMISEVEVVGGFDKEIEMRIYAQKKSIEYLPKAYVYDEKVQNVRVFSKQRRRWLSAQFHFFGKNIKPSVKALLRDKNYEYFFKALQYIQLPRIILLGITVLAAIFSNIFLWYPWNLLWGISLLMLFFTFIFAIPKKFYTFKTLKALSALPVGFATMLISLLRIHKANESFIHTKHTYNAFQIKRKKTGK
jgi:cellulose synthase/poly-beta-1,6-N-acetylglucosamine synthase-like glycosyltransferase